MNEIDEKSDSVQTNNDSIIWEWMETALIHEDIIIKRAQVIASSIYFFPQSN